MEAFLTSTFTVLAAEMGDKTQLLAIVLAARFRRPVPIILGIFIATLFNHALAAYAGEWVGHALHPDTLRWVVGLAFVGAAGWALIPDRVEEGEAGKRKSGSAFWTTLIAFFLAENADKTQLATLMLAARYQSLIAVAGGTTLGMMMANIPAVLAGEALTRRLPLKYFRYFACLVFAALGIFTLFYN